MNFSTTERTAIVRGLYNAVLTFAGTFLVTLQTADSETALIAAGVAACVALGFRAVGEGVYDSKRDAAGDVRPGDVTASTKP